MACITHHHACDCREARFAEIEQQLAEAEALMHEAAVALESHSLHERAGEPFLRCLRCGLPADDEDGPQHAPGCLIARLRTAAESIDNPVVGEG